MADEMKTAQDIPTVQRYVAVLWPSFITAGIATILFFAAFDPINVLECNGYYGGSRMAAYSLGFFLFWLLTAFSSLLGIYFGRPCELVNENMHRRDAQ